MSQVSRKLLTSVITILSSVLVLVLVNIGLIKPNYMRVPILGICVVDESKKLCTEIIVGALAVLESNTQISYFSLAYVVDALHFLQSTK